VTLARDLYDFNLPEEGDRWAARVEALTPGSDQARLLTLIRANTTGQTELSLQIARSMIEDQVTHRQGAYPEALFRYTDLMIIAGRQREAYDFLLQLRPELADIENFPDDINGRMMAYSASMLAFGFLPEAEAREAWLTVTAAWDATGLPWREFSILNPFIDAALRGEHQQAAITLEDILTEATIFDYIEMRALELPYFSELSGDPAVVARLAELDRDFQAARQQVMDMLQQPEWAE
jgi:hypothetical protein